MQRMSMMPPSIPVQNFPQAPPRQQGLGIALGLAIGLIIMFFGVGVGFVAGYFMGQNVGWNDAMGETDATGYGTEADGFTVGIESPSSVEAGQVFTITLTCANSLAIERSINSVDVASSLCQGMSVVESDPETIETGEPHDEYEYREHIIEVSVPPHSSTVITLTCRAETPGVFAGDIDVYVDGWTVATGSLSIEVTGEAPKPRPRF